MSGKLCSSTGEEYNILREECRLRLDSQGAGVPKHKEEFDVVEEVVWKKEGDRK